MKHFLRMTVLALGALWCHPSSAQDVSTDILNTVMIEGVENNGMVSVMTGGVIDIKDSQGYKYILTARHGIIDPQTQKFLPEKGIIVKSFHGDYIGMATVAFCDDHRDIRPGQETNEYNITHDVCVLKMVPQKTKPEYQRIPGYVIPDTLGASYFSMCHTGLASWDQGASGSPLFDNGAVLQGVLSATYDEKKISETEWQKMLAEKNVKVPKQVMTAPSGRPVVYSSCAVFVPPTPDVLMYLGIDPQKIKWVNDPVPDGTAWGSLSLPVFRPVYIWSNEKNSIDNQG